MPPDNPFAQYIPKPEENDEKQPANPFAQYIPKRPGVGEQFVGDVGRGFTQMKQLGYGLAGLGADALNYPETRDAALQRYKEIGEDVEKNNAPVIGTYKNIHSVGDAGRYAVEAVGENLAMALPSLVSGGVGAIAARKLGQAAVTKLAEEQIAKGVGEAAARQAASKLATKQATIGGMAGAYPASAGMEAGSIYGDVFEKTGQKEPGIAAGYGAAAGLFDMIPEGKMFGRMLGEASGSLVLGQVVKRLGVAGAKQFLSEAPTEAIQTMIEHAAVKQADPSRPYWTAELADDMIDSFLKGGLGSVPQGVASEAVGMRRQARNEKLNPPPETPPDQTVPLTPRQKLENIAEGKDANAPRAPAPPPGGDRPGRSAGIGAFIDQNRNAMGAGEPTPPAEAPPVAPPTAPPPAPPDTVRLYRGEGGDSTGSVKGGGWFTTDPDKAALYGAVSYMDVPKTSEVMAHFAQGHGGPDEHVTDQGGLAALAAAGITPKPLNVGPPVAPTEPELPRAPAAEPPAGPPRPNVAVFTPNDQLRRAGYTDEQIAGMDGRTVIAALEQLQDGNAPKTAAEPPVAETTPEPKRDILAQIEALADPNNPKDAVFIAKGNEDAIPNELPPNIEVVPRAEGTLLTTNEDKAKAFEQPVITDADIARILDLPETKQDALASGQPVVVQGKDAQGNVVKEAVASADKVDATKAAIVPELPAGGTVETVNPIDVQKRRFTPPPPVEPTPERDAVLTELARRARAIGNENMAESLEKGIGAPSQLWRDLEAADRMVAVAERSYELKNGLASPVEPTLAESVESFLKVDDAEREALTHVDDELKKRVLDFINLRIGRLAERGYGRTDDVNSNTATVETTNIKSSIHGMLGALIGYAKAKESLDKGYKRGSEETVARRLSMLEDDLTAVDPGEVDRLAERVVRFASGMSRYKDFDAAVHAGHGVGVEIGEMSDKSLRDLAKLIVEKNGKVFVDSGAFNAWRRGMKVAHEPATFAPLNFDQVLAAYEKLTGYIDAYNNYDPLIHGELDEHDPEQVYAAMDEPNRGAQVQIHPPLMVMPDIVGDQAGSIALVERYANWIKTATQFPLVAQPIVPLQRGERTLAEAFDDVVRILGTDKFIVGIPSNAAAVTGPEFTEFLRSRKPMGVHILGALADSRLRPRLEQIIAAGVGDTILVSADANILRSQIVQSGMTSRGRADKIIEVLGERTKQSAKKTWLRQFSGPDGFRHAYGEYTDDQQQRILSFLSDLLDRTPEQIKADYKLPERGALPGEAAKPADLAPAGDAPFNPDNTIHTGRLGQLRRAINKSGIDPSRVSYEGSGKERFARVTDQTSEEAEQINDLLKREYDITLNRSEAAKARRYRTPMDIVQYLASLGGIKPDPDLPEDFQRFTQYGHLIRETGLQLDYAREKAIQDRYIKPDSDISQLIEAIDENHRGRRKYSEYDFERLDEIDREARAAEEQERDRLEGLEDEEWPPYTSEQLAQIAEREAFGAELMARAAETARTETPGVYAYDPETGERWSVWDTGHPLTREEFEARHAAAPDSERRNEGEPTRPDAGDRGEPRGERGAEAPGPTSPPSGGGAGPAEGPAQEPSGQAGKPTEEVTAPVARPREPTPLPGTFSTETGPLLMKTGMLLVSKSGRPLSPYPKVSTDTGRKTKGTIARVDAWLKDEARKEVAREHPHLRLMIDSIQLGNVSMSDRDTMNDVLFGHPNGPTTANLPTPVNLFANLAPAAEPPAAEPNLPREPVSATVVPPERTDARDQPAHPHGQLHDAVPAGDAGPGAEDAQGAAPVGDAGPALAPEGSGGERDAEPDIGAGAEGQGGLGEPGGGPGSVRGRAGDADRLPDAGPGAEPGPVEQPAPPAPETDTQPTPKAKPDANVKGVNFSIQPGELEEERSPRVKARDNVAAIELAKKLIKADRPATRAEQLKLAKYVGWGGLAGIFTDSTGIYGKGFESLGPRLKELLTQEEYTAASRSTQYAHYTAEHVIRSMWDAVRAMGFKGGMVLEPGMGVGHFAGLMPADLASAVNYQGIEFDPLTAQIAKLLYPQSGIRHADFIRTPIPDNTFDLAIGNPPFGDITISADPKYKARGFLLHDYFFAKSLDSVRPGGLMAFVTSAGTMNKMDADARRYMAERAEFVGGVRLPSTAFKKNAGTEVTTDVLFFKKREQPISVPDLPDWARTVIRTLADSEGTPVEGHVSRYFSDHPEQVLGQEGFFDKLYRGRYGVRAPEGQDLPSELTAALDRLPKNIMDAEQTPGERADVDFASGQKKDGSFYIQNGKLMQYQGGAGKPVLARGKGVEGGKTSEEMVRIRALLPVRDALRDVFAADLAEDAEKAAAARKTLNTAYERFVKQHGAINKTKYTFTRPNRIAAENARSEAREEARSLGLPWDEGDFDPSDMIRAKAKLQAIAAARQEAREKAEKQGRKFDEGTFDPADMDDIVSEKKPNLDPFRDDPESYRLGSIESYDAPTETGTKKRIFTESILTREEEPQINSAPDGVLWSLNKLGRLDVDAIAAKMEKPVSEIVDELGDKIFRLPDTENTYETADAYLSGDVVDKLAIARAAADLDPSLHRNVEALQANQPKPLAPSEISIRLGMPWIEPQVFREFIDSRLQLGEVKLRWVPPLGEWRLDASGAGRASGYQMWSTEALNAYDILRAALNRHPPKIYDTFRQDGKTVREFNPVATQAAVDKYQAMIDAFTEWAVADREQADRLAAAYNATHNRVVVRQFDGSYLKTPGVSKEWSWRPHQLRVIARIIQAGMTYMAHAVGAGKTSAMIGAGMEMRRLGLVRKPMYVVPNHMLGQFTKEFYEQYPTARIAVADDRRFHTDRRKQFMADVAQDDLDAVIITHSSFKLIQLGDAFQDSLIQDEISDLQDVWSELDPQEDRVTRKRIENQIEKMEQRLSGRGGSEKDQGSTFEEMGVDFLFVDEAHLFRKLDYATRQNLKGIDPKGSDQAWDLYAKMRYLESRNPGRAGVFASGTPVTNTMGELFSISRYLQPQELRKRGIGKFDAWSSTFGEVKSDLEQQPDGSYKPVERFAKFINAYDLYRMVAGVMDIVTSEQLEQYVTRPQLKNGQRTMILAPRTDALAAYQATLSARMKAIAERKGPPEPGDDIILNVIHDGRHAAIDMRYVDPLAPNDPESKLNQMIARVFQTWKDTADTQFYDPATKFEKKAFRGPATQMVFMNLGVNETARRPFSGYTWMRRELIRLGVPRDQVAFINDYSGTVAKQRLFNDMNEGKVRILVGTVAKMGTGVNAQRRLVGIHNQDALWFPADDTQRNGRGLRQGNFNPEVEISDYSTKATYDSTMWQMMGRKGRFIEQFFRGDPELRDMEDLGEASQYEQASAFATSDERVIKLTEMRQELEKAVRRQQAHDREQYNLRQIVQEKKESAVYWRDYGKRLALDIKTRVDTRGDAFRMSINGKKYAARKDAAAALSAHILEVGPTLPKETIYNVGTLGGFDFVYDRGKGDTGTHGRYFIRSASGQPIMIRGTVESGIGLIASAESTLRGFEDDAKYAEGQVAKAIQQGEDAQKEIGKEFKGGDAIKRLAADVKALERELAPKDPEPGQERYNQRYVQIGELPDNPMGMLRELTRSGDAKIGKSAVSVVIAMEGTTKFQAAMDKYATPELAERMQGEIEKIEVATPESPVPVHVPDTDRARRGEQQREEDDQARLDEEGGTPYEPAGTPAWAAAHAYDLRGRVVYSNNETGLLAGSSMLTGEPVYIGLSGNLRTKIDIDSYTGNIFTPEQLADLRRAKVDVVAADHAAFARDPQGPFASYKPGTEVIGTDSIDQRLVETAAGWRKMLGIKGRIILVDPSDVYGAKGDKYGLNGPFAAIRAMTVKTTGDTHGIFKELSNGDYVVALKPRARTSATLETLAHEIGHILQREAYEGAPAETKAKLQTAWKRFLEQTKNKNALQYIQAMRAHTIGKAEGRNRARLEAVTGADLGAYWQSFSEWFADQVSRWATTDEKPLSVVDKFFAKIANGFRRLIASVTGKRYTADPEMLAFLADVGNRSVLSRDGEEIRREVPTPDAGPPIEAQESRSVTEDDLRAAEKIRQARAAERAKLMKGPLASFVNSAPMKKVTSGAMFQQFMETLAGVQRALMMNIVPMAVGTARAQAIAKRFMNETRHAEYLMMQLDRHIEKAYSFAEREEMGDALDEESAMNQTGTIDPKQGLGRLSPDQRATVEMLNDLGKRIWGEMYEVGIVKAKKGLPHWMPRQFVRMAENGDTKMVGQDRVVLALDQSGDNVSTAGPRRRKYLWAAETEAAGKKSLGDDVKLVRDIRVLVRALSKNQRAIASRKMIDSIRQAGRDAGDVTVAENDPGGSKYFTLAHPAFKTWGPVVERDKFGKPKLDDRGKVVMKLDADGDPAIEQHDLHILREFEGPLRAVLTSPPGALYRAIMHIKSGVLSMIMFSPMIHNMVEYGRAFPLMPGKMLTLRVYRDGARARHMFNKKGEYDPEAAAVMKRALDAGYVPIGRNWMSDVSGLAADQSLFGGKSITARVLGSVVGSVGGEKAEQATRRGVDKAGEFWHGTLLWERIADLQAGLFVNLEKKYLEAGYSPRAASSLAAHMANRYAGALPQEAMSNAARAVANVVMFSRSFTIGNLGVMKDMFTGLPRDVQAELEARVGPLMAQAAKSAAKRKAIAAFMIDIALFYGLNAAIQAGISGFGDDGWDEVAQGFVRRWKLLSKRVGEHPLDILNPFDMINSIMPQGSNETGKEDRILIGRDSEGRAMYVRNVFGKIGEEFIGWLTKPLEMMKRKTSTFVGPLREGLENRDYFGRELYDKEDKTMTGAFHAMGALIGHFMAAQVPSREIGGLYNFVTGEPGGGKDALKAVLPLVAGTTMSEGHPLGPQAGEIVKLKEKQKQALLRSARDINRTIKKGDIDSAYERLITLGLEPMAANRWVRSTLDTSKRSAAAQAWLRKHGSEADIERIAHVNQ